MTRFGPVFLAAALALGSVGLVPGRAQAQAASNQIDIPHHIANSHEVETPFGVWHLPRWEPIHLGGLSIDMAFLLRDVRQIYDRPTIRQYVVSSPN